MLQIPYKLRWFHSDPQPNLKPKYSGKKYNGNRGEGYYYCRGNNDYSKYKIRRDSKIIADDAWLTDKQGKIRNNGNALIFDKVGLPRFVGSYKETTDENGKIKTISLSGRYKSKKLQKKNTWYDSKGQERALNPWLHLGDGWRGRPIRENVLTASVDDRYKFLVMQNKKDLNERLKIKYGVEDGLKPQEKDYRNVLKRRLNVDIDDVNAPIIGKPAPYNWVPEDLEERRAIERKRIQAQREANKGKRDWRQFFGGV